MPSPSPHDNLTDIRRQFDEAQRQFNALEMKPRESLRDFELRKGSHKKSDLRTSGNYLLKHSRAGRMNYADARRDKLPIGSGVIESTIRRVVNLRLKGASVYWKESTANDMLLLRCLYKANRWEYIEKQDMQRIIQAA